MIIVAAPTRSSASPAPVRSRRPTRSGERVGDDVAGNGERGDRASRDDEDLAATPVTEPSCERLADEDHRADRCDRQRDPEAAHAEVVVGIDGDDREQHPDGRAQGELRQHREHERLRQDAVGLHRSIQADRIGAALRQERRRADPNQCAMSAERRSRFERKDVGKPPRQPWQCSSCSSPSRSSASPRAWELLGLPWWIWLVLGVPALLLTIDLLLALRGNGLVQSRRAALVLLGFLAAGNFGALGILVAGLVSTNASELTGGELLLTGLRDLHDEHVVFGLIFWEVEDGGPVARLRADERGATDFRFPAGRRPARRAGTHRCGTTSTSP